MTFEEQLRLVGRRLDGLEARLVSRESRVAEVEGALVEVEGALDEHDEQFVVLEDRVGALEGREPVVPDPVVPDPAGWGEEPVPAATLFVSTDGDDAAGGRSVDRPLRTLQHAASLARAGDCVHIRGGVYPIQFALRRSGTAERPIVWTAAPGEKVILSGLGRPRGTAGDRVWVENVRWNVLANLEVADGPREGILVMNASNNAFLNLRVHGCHFSGITVIRGDNNLFERILTHDNFDAPNGEHADGISISTGDQNILRRIIACRNSDDGIDAWTSTRTLIEKCAAYDNGRANGDGNGVKAGGNRTNNRTMVRQCISFNNAVNGFGDNNGHNITFVNNTAFNNGRYNFAFGETAMLRNNLSLEGRIGVWGADHQFNSWNLNHPSDLVASVDPGSLDFLSLAREWLGGTTDYGVTSPQLGALPYGKRIADLLGRALEVV